MVDMDSVAWCRCRLNETKVPAFAKVEVQTRRSAQDDKPFS